MDDNKINLNYVLDSQGARLERTNKRFFVLAVVLLIILLITNGLWIYYETQFKTVCIEAEQEADNCSNNYIIGGDYGVKAES